MSQGTAAPASNLLASLRARQATPAPVSESTATPPPATLAHTPPPVAPAPTEPAPPPAYGPINPPESKLATEAPSAAAAPEAPPAATKKRAKRTTTPEQVGTPGPAAPAGAKPFTLYVDAYPQGAPAKCIEDLVDAAKRAVCAAKEVGDYRYLEYGTGPGAVSEAFFDAFDRACAEEDAPAGWVVHTSTFEASFLLSGLAARASVVVRGIR